MSDHSECANKIQLLQHECDRSREALTAAEERAQRAERERHESVIANQGLMAQIKFNTEQHHALLDSWIRQQEKDEATITTLTPLAEWARQQIEPELKTLAMLEDVPVQHSIAVDVAMRKLVAESYAMLIVSAKAGRYGNKWFEITDEGREHLVYLRGLVGEEKAECQQ